MRDEIQRISKLVAEGRLSPEDAADLIDAFYASDRGENGSEESTPPPPPPGATASATSEPKPNFGFGSDPVSLKDSFKSLIDSVEKLTKEGVESVNWQEVSRQARVSATKGFEVIKNSLDDISKGKVGIHWPLSNDVREISLPLSVVEGKTLRIENAVGDVKIVGGFDVGSVTAKARFRAASAEEAKQKGDAYTPIIEESDHQIVIRQPDVSGLHVDIQVNLAGHANVEVKAESGDIEVLDTRGGCRITSRQGDVKVRNLNGVIEITCSSGDVDVQDVQTPLLTLDNKSGDLKVKGLQGNLNARTASGDVDIQVVNGKTVAIESVSGDIQLDIVEPITGTVNLRTVNGDARVQIADGADARVSLSTLRGDVSCVLDLEDSQRQSQRITGRIGAGSGSIDLSAVTGDVSLNRRDASN